MEPNKPFESPSLLVRAAQLVQSSFQLRVVRLLVESSIPAALALASFVLAHSGCVAIPPANCNPGAPQVNFTSINSPLPDRAFNADISLPYGLPRLKAGQQEFAHVLVRNNSDVVWPAIGQTDSKYYIRLGDHWRDVSNTTLLHGDDRRNLPYDIEPGQQAEFLIPVTPPKIPGAYTFEIDLVQEKITWFSQKGSKALVLKVTVE